LNPLGVGVCAVFSLSSFVNLLLAAALYFNYKSELSGLVFTYLLPILENVYVTILLVSLIAQFNIYYVALLLAVDHRKRGKEADEGTIYNHLVGFSAAAGLYAANGLLANLGDYFGENVMFL
jgi:hypothetical protein